MATEFASQWQKSGNSEWTTVIHFEPFRDLEIMMKEKGLVEACNYGKALQFRHDESFLFSKWPKIESFMTILFVLT